MSKYLADHEIAHTGLTELKIVGFMHERKALMERISDGFIALPGGFGTWDELFEIVTWAQLGLHHKPIGVLNVSQYYEPMISMVYRAVEDGFISEAYGQQILFDESPEKLMERFLAFKAAFHAAKWAVQV